MINFKRANRQDPGSHMETYSSFTDLELITLLKEGDKMAYTEIYKRYYYLMYVHAYKKLRDADQAKDVIQEMFTFIWTKRETFLTNKSLSGYLYTSVRNRILDYFAHQQVESKYIHSLKDYLETEDSDTTDYLVREHELNAYIQKEIQALPPKMREVFELSRKQNLTHKEIAEKLGLTEQTVSKQVTNALKILRTKLGIFIYLYFILHS